MTFRIEEQKKLQDLYVQRKISRRDFMRNTLLLGGSLVAAQSFLAACAPVSAPAAEAPAAAAVASGPVTGGTLKLAKASTDLFWDPYYNNPQGGSSYVFYDRLFTYAAEDPIVEVGSLAESWEEEPQSLTIKLREGVLFHNGREMLADDIVANVERALNKEIGHYLADIFNASVSGAEAIDKYTVRINYSKVYPLKLADLSQLFIIAPEGMDDLNNRPAGSGPWMWGSYEPGNKVEYVKNPNYWNQPYPYMDGLELKFIDDPQARIAAVEVGEIDVVNAVPYAEVARIRDAGELTVIENAPGGLWWMVGFNVSRPPFDNKLVRQAFSYALDREKIAQLALFGLVEATQTRYRPGQFWYSKEADSFYTFDLDKAKALLDEAGITDLKTEIIVSEAVLPTVKAMAEIWQQDLAKIGVTMEVADVAANLYSEKWGASEFDIISSATGDGRLDPSPHMGASSFYRATNNKLQIQDAPFFAEYESLKSELLSTIDPDERKVIYDKIQLLIQDSAWVLPYAVWSSFTILSPQVQNYFLPADSRDMWEQTWLAG